MIYTTWLEVDTAALVSNVRILQQHTGRPIMAVVKANAYGHGMVESAEVFKKAGAEWLAAARAEEALQLRAGGLTGPILILGYTPPEQAATAIQAGISLAVYDAATAQAYSQAAGTTGVPAKLHIKIDTGMTRLGIQPEELAGFATHLHNLPHVQAEGVFTHFACADSGSPAFTVRQIARFNSALATITTDGLLVHAANSAATIAYPDSWYDCVRPGIALYGHEPSPEVPLLPGIKPAITWQARITRVQAVKAGTTISYGAEYTTPQDQLIATVALGYADGFTRLGKQTPMLHFRGHPVPVVGRVCMDQLMVNVSEVTEKPKLGDAILVYGTDASLPATAENHAATLGTINYEVLTSLAHRLPRIYL